MSRIICLLMALVLGISLCVPAMAQEADAPALDVANQLSGFTVSESSICMDVGFYLQGSPNGPISIELMEQQLNAIRPYSDTIRLYSASGEVAKAYPLAKILGFQVVGSAWLCGDETADRQELDALIELCNSGLCCAAVVGSETLLRGDLTPAELISNISYVRERLADPSIPVTTADSIDCILENAGVRNACDFLFVNAYPYWSGVGIEHAAESFIASVEALKAKCPGKEVMISETGWPTEGDAVEDAVPGEQEAAARFWMSAGMTGTIRMCALFMNMASWTEQETASSARTEL